MCAKCRSVLLSKFIYFVVVVYLHPVTTIILDLLNYIPVHESRFTVCYFGRGLTLSSFLLRCVGYNGAKSGAVVKSELCIVYSRASVTSPSRSAHRCLLIHISLLCYMYVAAMCMLGHDDYS